MRAVVSCGNKKERIYKTTITRLGRQELFFSFFLEALLYTTLGKTKANQSVCRCNLEKNEKKREENTTLTVGREISRQGQQTPDAIPPSKKTHCSDDLCAGCLQH